MLVRHARYGGLGFLKLRNYELERTVINHVGKWAKGNVYEVRSTESSEFKHLVNVDQSVKYENILFYKDGSHKVLTDGYVVSSIGGHYGKYPNPRDVIKIL